MIDLHCHILPVIDDGPATAEGAVALARAATAAGTATMVATPHVSWTYPHVDADLIADRVRLLNALLRAHGIDLEVRTGAEVAHTRAFDLADEELVRLRLGGGPWLLLECPLAISAPGFDAAATELAKRGHHILLAHPERSPPFQRDPGLLERLVGRGMIAQVTADSLLGRFGGVVRDTAWEMLGRGLVANVASDAHSAGPRRSPALGDALGETALTGEQIEHLARAVPLAVLSGAPPPPAPPMPETPRRGIVRRALRRVS